MTKFFCYGSLKRDFSDHDMIRSKSVFIGEAKTESRYQLYEMCWFPGMVKVKKNGINVHGELYEIIDDETFIELDRYEGVPSLFKRSTIILDDGQEAVAYLFNQNPSDFEIEIIKDGVWKHG